MKANRLMEFLKTIPPDAEITAFEARFIDDSVYPVREVRIGLREPVFGFDIITDTRLADDLIKGVPPDNFP